MFVFERERIKNSWICTWLTFRRWSKGQVCLSPTIPVYQNKCKRAKMNGSCKPIWFLFLDYFFIIFIRLALSACTLYHTSKIQKTFYQTTRLIIKKKQDVNNDLHPLWNSFFSTKLNEWHLKRKLRRPFNFTVGGIWQTIL